MDTLYAPWREKYIVCRDEKQEKILPACVFCVPDKNDPVKNGCILKQFEYVSVLLNLYPYNAGHLLITPRTHVTFLHELPERELTDMMKLTSKSAQILQNALGAQGVNVGMNLGAVAGAGIPGHLHMHLVPRWPGDTNFMPVIGQTKQVSIDMQRVHADLLPHFEKLEI
ncbi:HIT domain-containing protein [bacterium]|nr:HIT domain-containing protein [bacterium]NBX77769.1 HIT domain-containing protein [bacterium]